MGGWLPIYFSSAHLHHGYGRGCFLGPKLHGFALRGIEDMLVVPIIGLRVLEG